VPAVVVEGYQRIVPVPAKDKTCSGTTGSSVNINIITAIFVARISSISIGAVKQITILTVW
jgi:hypothetical protein